jgi:hypothetical protein
MAVFVVRRIGDVASETSAALNPILQSQVLEDIVGDDRYNQPTKRRNSVFVGILAGRSGRPGAGDWLLVSGGIDRSGAHSTWYHSSLVGRSQEIILRCLMKRAECLISTSRVRTCADSDLRGCLFSDHPFLNTPLHSSSKWQA